MAALLGDWPARGSGSLAARLAFSLRSRILADLLPPGTTLPPERVLARALAVSRSTLVAALDLLRSEGLVISRQGRGTRIADPLESTGVPSSRPYATKERRNPPGGQELGGPLGVTAHRPEPGQGAGGIPAGRRSDDNVSPIPAGGRNGPDGGTCIPADSDGGRLAGRSGPDGDSRIPADSDGGRLAGRSGPDGDSRMPAGREAGGGGTQAGRAARTVPVPTMAARLLGAAERGINFGISAPPAASALPVLAVTSADLLAVVPAHGYDPAGLLVLRAALAERHSATGLPTTADQISVTHGAQQAIDLALATVCRPGDAVAVEDPTYPGVLDVLAARGLRPVPLAADSRGPTPAALEAAAREHGARCAFLLPAVHNPTGRVLDPGRREALARALDQLEMSVVEDNTLADLVFDPHPEAAAGRRDRDRTAAGRGDRPPSLAELCERALVVTVETTSKVAWGGLRVGWLRAPAGVIERSMQLRTANDLGCSVPAQLLALQLLEHYDELITSRRAALRRSAERFSALLSEAIPGCEFIAPAGGLSLWVRLPGGADAAALASRALRHGVSVAPGRFASPTGGLDHLRLCHDRPDEELVEGTARLAAAWSETAAPRPLP